MTVDRNVEPKLASGIYRHTKSGKLYSVIGVACHTETGELLVAYRPMYRYDHPNDLFVRSYAMFVEVVELDGQLRPRFEYVAD